MGYNKKLKKSNGRSFPYVNFTNCNQLELKLMDWLGNDRLINESMGLVLLRLHLLRDDDNLIEIRDYNSDDNSFKCIINERYIYDIRIDNLDDKNKDKEIVVNSDDIQYTYICEGVRNIELGMRIRLSSYKKDYLYGLVKLTHYLSRDYTMFDIDYMGYSLKFNVIKPNDMVLPIFDEDGKYARYKLENEEGLVLYLVNLIPPFNLVDVYNNICEISLLDDISKYREVYLEVSKKDKVIDLIHFMNGELERFGITYSDERSLFLNKDDSWEYYYSDMDTMNGFSMNVIDCKVNYNICVDRDYGHFRIGELIKDNMEYANMEIENVKVLSKKLINENSNK